MDRMEAPQRRTMKPSVDPVAHEVADYDHFDGLQRQRLLCQQSIRRDQHPLYVSDVSSIQDHKNRCEAKLRDRFRDRRQKPISDVGEQAVTSEARLSGIRREQRLDQRKQSRQYDESDDEV